MRDEAEIEHTLTLLLEYQASPRDFVFSDHPKERFWFSVRRPSGTDDETVAKEYLRARWRGDCIHPFVALFGIERWNVSRGIRELCEQDSGLARIYRRLTSYDRGDTIRDREAYWPVCE